MPRGNAAFDFDSQLGLYMLLISTSQLMRRTLEQ